MNVKIFQAFGRVDIERIEVQINSWLQDSTGVNICHTDTALASVAEDISTGEMFQALVISIWYEDSN